MEGRWINTTIGDQATLQRGIDITKAAQRIGTIPVISSGGVSSFHDTPGASGPGVILGRKGVIGSVYYVPSDFWPHDTTLWVKDFHGNEPRFVYYFFRSIASQLGRLDVGSANPTLNRNHVHPIPVQWPSVPEQRAIAHILGTLDDKIELNRRMNQTLEEMARALFKSWFVDFDPVRAKAAGKAPPGLAPEIAALFPDRFQDSKLGEIPEGWTSRTIGEVAKRVAMGPFGSDIKTDNFIDSGVPVIRGGNLRNGFEDERFVFVSESKADDLRNANAFAGDIVITHRGTLGQVGLIPLSCRFRRYIVSQSQMLLSIDPNASTPRFVYEFLKSPVGQHALLANTSQTGVPAIARPTTSLRAIPILCPPMIVLRAFEDFVRPALERALCLVEESRILAALCNSLLPRLLSGDLRLSQSLPVMEAGA